MCDKIQTRPTADQCWTQTDLDDCSNFRTSSNQICKSGNYGVCEGGDYCWPHDLTSHNAGWKYGLHLDTNAVAIIDNNSYTTDCSSNSEASCDNSWTQAALEFSSVPSVDITSCTWRRAGGHNLAGCIQPREQPTFTQGVVTFNPDEYNSCSKVACPGGQIKDPSKIGTVCRTATGCTTRQCCMVHDCDKHGPPYGASEAVWAEWARKCPKEAAGCGGNKNAAVPWGASEAVWANWVKWCPKEAKAATDAKCKSNYPDGPPYGASERDWAVWHRLCNYVEGPTLERCTVDTWGPGGVCPEK
jgi:hypothetical protein